jgi:hypothetical protein
MPEVDSGGTKPFVITRDSARGDWQVLRPTSAESGKDVYGSQLRHDPYAVIYTGKDFAQGSCASICDTVICQRLRNEYYATRDAISREFDDSPSGLRNKERLTKEPAAMISFFEDNIGSFSHKLTDYLTTLERPFAALIEMCPFSLATGRDGWSYNADLAPDAIDRIESGINDRLNDCREDDIEAGANEDGKMSDYGQDSVISSITVNGCAIRLGENANQAEPFHVIAVRDGHEPVFDKRTGDYAEALKAYSEQIADLAWELRVGRDAETVTLTAEHCLPGGKSADFTEQLIVVAPSAFLPEYRTSESQLAKCTHGNGARPDAIGTSVFCKELYTGNSVVFGRHQILGVADESKLPKWAKAKLGLETEKPPELPEQPKEPEKPKNYELIVHGRRDEINLGAFATVAEAKQYAAESDIKNFSVKKRGKESLLGSLDRNKAKVARGKAASPAQPGKTKQKEVGD